jgi:hypothetical protein
MLEDEIGLHILDYEQSDDSGRTVARVMVKPTPWALPESAARLPA